MNENNTDFPCSIQEFNTPFRYDLKKLELYLYDTCHCHNDLAYICQKPTNHIYKALL